MEKNIFDFISKATDLILQSRFVPADFLTRQQEDSSKSHSLILNGKPNPHLKIPEQWNSQTFKIISLDFYLRNRTSFTKTLAERWFFEIGPVSNKHPIEDTIDSIDSLNKKLQVLLRTITLLAALGPLHRLKDSEDLLREEYECSHSFVFSKVDLPSWSGISTESQESQGSWEGHDDSYYTNPDLILPGRVFSVKVFSLENEEFLETFPVEQAEEVNQIEPSPGLKVPISPEKGKRRSSAMLTEDSLEFSEKDEVFVFDELENTIKVFRKESTKGKEAGLKISPKKKRYSVKDEMLMKKISEPNKDDRIVELLTTAQKLRSLSLSMSIESPFEEKGKTEEEKIQIFKGLVFTGKTKQKEDDQKDLFSEYKDLGTFYSVLKRR